LNINQVAVRCLLNAAKGTVCNATYLYKIPTAAFF